MRNMMVPMLLLATVALSTGVVLPRRPSLQPGPGAVPDQSHSDTTDSDSQATERAALRSLFRCVGNWILNDENNEKYNENTKRNTNKRQGDNINYMYDYKFKKDRWFSYQKQYYQPQHLHNGDSDADDQEQQWRYEHPLSSIKAVYSQNKDILLKWYAYAYYLYDAHMAASSPFDHVQNRQNSLYNAMLRSSTDKVQPTDGNTPELQKERQRLNTNEVENNEKYNDNINKRQGDNIDYMYDYKFKKDRWFSYQKQYYQPQHLHNGDSDADDQEQQWRYEHPLSSIKAVYSQNKDILLKWYAHAYYLYNAHMAASSPFDHVQNRQNSLYNAMLRSSTDKVQPTDGNTPELQKERQRLTKNEVENNEKYNDNINKRQGDNIDYMYDYKFKKDRWFSYQKQYYQPQHLHNGDSDADDQEQQWRYEHPLSSIKAVYSQNKDILLKWYAHAYYLYDAHMAASSLFDHVQNKQNSLYNAMLRSSTDKVQPTDGNTPELQKERQRLNTNEVNPLAEPVVTKRDDVKEIGEKELPAYLILDKRDTGEVQKKLFSFWTRLQALSHKGRQLPTRRHTFAFFGPDGMQDGPLTAETRASNLRAPGQPLRWG